MSKKVSIIGGGIIGLCSAYYLLKEGYQVQIIDKSNITEGASFVNAGYITPSHFIPLAAPGMITKGLKFMLDSSSPFYLKPRLDKAFLKWVWLFQKSCTQSHVDKSMSSILDINLFSQKLFKDIYSSGDIDFHIEHKGLLMAFQSEASKIHEEKIVEKASELGLKVDYIDKQTLTLLEPNLIADGAFHYHSDSHTTPKLFMQSMLSYLKSNNVNFCLNEEIVNVNPKQEKLELVTKTNVYESDEVVIASGAWTESLVKKIGAYIPIQGGKGYCINTKRSLDISYPTILMEANTAVTPMKEMTRFAGTMELAGLNSMIKQERVNAIANAASKFYKNVELTLEEKNNTSFGFRPVSPDGLPYIGKLTKHPNITIATGHAMMGWSLGPGTGKLVQELISNRKPSISIDQFSPERFQ